MMQLAITVSFIMLLCSFFSTCYLRRMIAKRKYFKKTFFSKTYNNNYNIRMPMYHSIGEIIPPSSSSSCRLGVKSVSAILFTSADLQGQVFDVNESCKLFDPLKPTIVLSHGFLSSPYSFPFSDLASRLVQKGYTVLSLDWTDASCYNEPSGLRQLYYSYAAKNSREVGNDLASIIKSLIDVCKIPLSNIKLIGNSLGAHVSSFACKNLQKSGYGKPSLLIGSEPAAALFEDANCTDRFCESDAKRVIVFHTSAIGIQYSLGDYDLWFNNGHSQPTCVWILDEDLKAKCSHSIAVDYLTLTLDNAFIGVPTERRNFSISNPKPGCSSNTTNCIAVDNRIFDSNYNAMGDYCVSVSSKYPYFTTTKSKCQ